MVQISTGGQGTLQEGFFLVQAIPFTFTPDAVAGGADLVLDVVEPVVKGEFFELLNLFVTTNEVPAVAPALYVRQFITAWKQGISRDLTVGEVNSYEMDLTAIRMRAYFATSVYQKLTMLLTAHAANATTFIIHGLYAKYQMPM